jgi:hypothetical protein
MDTISFGELVKELTGSSFEEIYKEYIKGETKNEGNERESDVE